MTWLEVRESISSITTLCPSIRSIEIETHLEALRIAERHGYTVFDALILAAALQADSGILWSEDMQDGVVIDKRLRIVNPFVRERKV